MLYPPRMFHFLVCFIVVTVTSSLTTDEYRLHVNAPTFSNELYAVVSLFNGGLDGDSGASAFTNDWNGLFYPNLNQTWFQVSEISPYYPHIEPTVISQSQAIIMNAQAYFYITDAFDRHKFHDVVQKGARSLVTYGWDANYGGFQWQLSQKPKDAEKRKFYGSDFARKKSSEGQSYAIIALSDAYMVTNDTNYLQTALETLNAINTYFSDHMNTNPSTSTESTTTTDATTTDADTTETTESVVEASSTGNDFTPSILHDQNRDFSNGEYGYRNINDLIRKFEALLKLSSALHYEYEITSGATSYSSHLANIDEQIQSVGKFFVETVIKYSASSTSHAYVYQYYSPTWDRLETEDNQDSDGAGNVTKWVSPGLGLSLAYQLSRAVEQGYDPQWLVAAQKLVDFFIYSSAYDSGLIRHLYTDEHGTAVATEQNSWKVYADACRTFLHFGTIRNCGQQCLSQYDLTYHTVSQYLIDGDYNGWYESLDSLTHLPLNTLKGHIYKTPEAEINFYSEAIRLSTHQNLAPATTSYKAYRFRRWAISIAVLASLIFIITGVSYCLKRRKARREGIEESPSEDIWSRVFTSRDELADVDSSPAKNNDFL